ncbi:hypothetical protein LXL04_027677 [Taraxacum kok-saghyz]
MDIDLSPKMPKKSYGGEGGSYHAWCPNELPMLKQGNIGAGKLLLEKEGLALPRFSDSAKVAYVLQGSGVAGIVLPEKEEKVLAIKTGDSIALPFGVITWWYNKDDTELQILFLGDTKTGHKPGSFTDIFLTGSNGIFTIRFGFGADLVRLDGNAMCSPGFSCDSALQVTYIVRGSGRAQIVGVDGKRVLDTMVQAGNLFIVPRFFVVSKISENEGLEWFSIVTTPNPIFTHMAGRTSAWKALSPGVLQASFNVSPEVEKTFRSKRMNSEIVFAPSN